MGFFPFREVATGPTLQAAFEAAHAEARRQHGDSGQSGTLADLLGVVDVHDTPVSRADAEILADSIGDGDAATCHAIPLIVPAGAQPQWLLFGKAHR